MPQTAAGSATLSPAEEPSAACHKLDPQVVAALYAEHGEELQRFLQGVLRDGSLAADCLQATIAKLLERGHETRTETRKAWLFRVAFHEAMAYRRRAAVGDKVIQRVAWQGQPEPATAEERAIRLESVEAVKIALAGLRPEEREIVRMRIYEEKTFAVIARELRIPLGTALGRMRTALIKLRSKLGVSDEGAAEQE